MSNIPGWLVTLALFAVVVFILSALHLATVHVGFSIP